MNKLLLLGGTGLVGSRVIDLLSDQFDLTYPSSRQLDVTNQDQVKQFVKQIRPELILYAAGFTDVDLAEERKGECYLLNVKAVEFFTSEAVKLDIPFYYLSTDYVFDGTKEDKPYTEEDEPNPVTGVYAKSKRAGELITLKTSSKNCVIRLIMPFSAVYKKKMDIARLTLDKLKKDERWYGIVDQKVNPVFVDDLVYAIGKIMQTKSCGIYHIGAASYTTPYHFMKEIAKQFNLNDGLIEETTFEEFSKTRQAQRPQHTWLDTSKFRSQFGDGILHEVEEEVRLFKLQVDSQGGI